MLIAAIDPSLRRAAVCCDFSYLPLETRPQMKCFGSDKQSEPGEKDTVHQRIARYQDLTADICDWLESFKRPIDMLFIEAYGINPRNPQISTIEFGGILRYNLTDFTPIIFEVAPTRLKKFVSGKGTTEKNLLGGHIVEKWQMRWDNNDEYDAFGLWKFGCACANPDLCKFSYERECVADQMGLPKPPKVKREKPKLEWLMGFPPGWTDLEDSATQSFRRSPSTSEGE